MLLKPRFEIQPVSLLSSRLFCPVSLCGNRESLSAYGQETFNVLPELFWILAESIFRIARRIDSRDARYVLLEESYSSSAERSDLRCALFTFAD